jgi:hypothetical protein
MSHRDVRELDPRSAALDCSVQHISFIHINGRPVVSFVQSCGSRGFCPLISAPAVSPVVSQMVPSPPRSRWSRHRRYRLCGMMGSGSLTPVVWPLGPGDIAHSPRSSERLSPLLLNTHPPERRFSSSSFTQPFHDAANQRSDQRTESHIYDPHYKKAISCRVTFRMHMHHAEEYPYTIVNKVAVGKANVGV